MTKQEFTRFLRKEADKATADKMPLKCLAELIEAELDKYPEIEIETNKRLTDVYKAMREFAQTNKEGSCGCCPPDKAVDIAMETFGIGKDAKQAVAADKLDIDILDLLG